MAVCSLPQSRRIPWPAIGFATSGGRGRYSHIPHYIIGYPVST